MTTNVYDVVVGLLTSDSRWSADLGEWLIYVDDTGFDKILADSELCFLFAGDLLNIAAWKAWVVAGRVGAEPMDKLDETSLIIAEIRTGEVVFFTDYLLRSGHAGLPPQAWYGGTGGLHAKNCWEGNRCAKTAVESAIIADKFSGGTVLHFDRQSLETNVTNAEPLSGVMEQLRERGMMKHHDGNEYKLCDVAAASPAANGPLGVSSDAIDLANKVMTGNVPLSAPFPGMHQPWTDEKKQALETALRRFAPLAK